MCIKDTWRDSPLNGTDWERDKVKKYFHIIICTYGTKRNEMEWNETEWNKHTWRDSRNGPERNGREGEIEKEIKPRILKGEVSLYHSPPVRLVCNQLYDNHRYLRDNRPLRLIYTSDFGARFCSKLVRSSKYNYFYI